MNRVEKFKELRQIRKKIVFSLWLFLLILIVGIFTVDYSVNSLMGDENYVRVLSTKRLNNSYVEINIMNKKIYVCTAYIDRDYQKFKNLFTNTFRF